MASDFTNPQLPSATLRARFVAVRRARSELR